MTPCHQVAKDDGGGHGSSEPDHHTALGCKWNRVERYGALSHAQPSLRGLRSSQPCTLRPESSRRSSERAIGSYFKGCVGWKCCRGNFRPSACLQASARFYGSHHPDLTTSLDFPPCRVWHTSAIALPCATTTSWRRFEHGLPQSIHSRLTCCLPPSLQ